MYETRSSVLNRGAPMSFGHYVEQTIRKRIDNDQAAAGLSATFGAKRHVSALEQLAELVGRLPGDDPRMFGLATVELASQSSDSHAWHPTSEQSTILQVVGGSYPAPPPESVLTELAIVGFTDEIKRMAGQASEDRDARAKAEAEVERLRPFEKQAAEARNGLGAEKAINHDQAQQIRQLTDQLDYYRAQEIAKDAPEDPEVAAGTTEVVSGDFSRGYVA